MMQLSGIPTNIKIQNSAQNLYHDHEKKRFVPLNPIVIHELTMFNYNEQCKNFTHSFVTKAAHTTADFNEKYIQFRL